MIERKHLKSFPKWVFSVSLASLPIFVTLITKFLAKGFFDIGEVIHSGELYIVSIIASLEPLWELFQIKEKSVIDMVLFNLILLNVIIDISCYAVIIIIDVKESVVTHRLLV